MPAHNEGFIHEEVNEVLGRPPVWMARWGNTLILGIVVALLATSAFVYYPDVISGRAVIMPEGNQLITSPEHESKIKAVYVKDGSVVKKGDLLYVLQSIIDPSLRDTIFARAESVVRLQRIVNTEQVLPAKVDLAVLENQTAQHRILIQAPAYTAGKITLNQKVRISPVRYPHQEYGELEATIISLPSKEEKGMVTMEAALVKGTTTTNGNKLQIDLSTSGIATIITDKKTVFKRLFAFL